MRNIRLVLEFDGTDYAGWQYQPDRTTIQGALQRAIKATTGETVVVYGCSRTDAGVSACNYVANFHTNSSLPTERLRLALNAHLPPDILIKSAEEAAPDFHARFSACNKTYVYTLVRAVSPLRRRHAWEFCHALSISRMRAAAKLFSGRHDFRAFCQTRNRNGICTLQPISIAVRRDTVRFKITGNRFLYKLVRRIVGALVACGTGRLNAASIRAALAGRPHPGYTTAPACGLTLDSVEYD